MMRSPFWEVSRCSSYPGDKMYQQILMKGDGDNVILQVQEREAMQVFLEGLLFEKEAAKKWKTTL